MQIGVFELVDRDIAGISFGGVRGRWEAACTKYDGGVSTSVFHITSSSIESYNQVHDVYMFLFYPQSINQKLASYSPFEIALSL